MVGVNCIHHGYMHAAVRNYLDWNTRIHLHIVLPVVHILLGYTIYERCLLDFLSDRIG